MNKPLSSLAKTAIGIAFVGSTSMMGIRWMMQYRVRHSAMYKEAMECMRNDPNVIDILGEPITEKSVDVSTWKHYGYEDDRMWVSVPVKGPKCSGYLHYVATVENRADRKLRLSKIEFEVNGLKTITLKRDLDDKLSVPSSEKL